LGETTGRTFHNSIDKGLSWIAGANELKDDLRNLDQGLIWDSIGPRRRVTTYSQTAFRLLKISRALRVESLGIRYEARPDHFGWLLYALSRSGVPNAVQIAKATAAH